MRNPGSSSLLSIALLALASCEEHPEIDARLLVTGEPDSDADFPNRKVYNLSGLAREANGEVLVIRWKFLNLHLKQWHLPLR